jgi:hypothetical protein
VRLRKHLSFANVMSLAAVFIALGGSAPAATELVTLKKDTIGAKQLKKNSVRSDEVRNASLQAGDFAPGQLPRGEQGPQGPAGTARAYATVQPDASFAPGTKHPGFVDVFEPDGHPFGINCLVPEPGIDVTSPVSAVASPEWTWSGTSSSFIHAQTNVVECPEGTLEVRAYALQGNPPTVALSDRAGFTVLLP